MNIVGLRVSKSSSSTGLYYKSAVLCVFFFGMSGGAYSATPEEDWIARSTADGVVRAIRFDTLEEVSDHVHPDRGAGNLIFDTTTKASGNGALKMTIPSNSGEVSGSGSWRVNFSDSPFEVQFGENSEFFIQWRQRFDPYLLEHTYLGGGGIKQIIVGQGDSEGVEANACGELQIVVHNSRNYGLPQAFHSCWVYLPYHEHDGTDWLLQNAAGCRWRSDNPDPNDGSCIPYVANEFMTFQIHVKLGSWQEDVPDPLNSGKLSKGFFPSVFEMWVAREGEPSKLSHRFEGVLMRRGNYNDNPVDSSHTAKYGKIWLTTYNTGKDAAETHEEASTWYDEVIISTQRIADPLVVVARPLPPTELNTE